MNKLRTVLLASILAVAALVPTAGIATATGNCGTAYVIVWSGDSGTGLWRKYCYGVNDPDISSETATVMGPLYDGTFKSDFDTSASTSGVSSITFHDHAGGSDVRVCFYENKNASGLIVSVTNSGTLTFSSGSDNIAESFIFSTLGSCP